MTPLIPILFAFAISAEPALREVSDYQYYAIPTAVVVKVNPPTGIENEWRTLMKYAPRFSSYSGMKVVGINESFIPCIKGKSFKSVGIRTEDMLWLNEAFAERATCIGLTQTYFQPNPWRSRQAINAPLAIPYPPAIIRSPPTGTSPYIVVYRDGDSYPEVDMSVETLFRVFNGDYTDYLEGLLLTNKVSAVQDLPVRKQDFIKTFELLNATSGDDDKMLINRTEGGVWATIPYTDVTSRGEAKSFFCGYNLSSHTPLPEFTTFPSETTTNSTGIFTGTCDLVAEQYKSISIATYLSDWKDVEYTKATKTEEYVTENRNETTSIQNGNTWFGGLSTNDYKRGGFNRVSDSTIGGAIHWFSAVCIDYDYEMIDTYVEKYVFIVEREGTMLEEIGGNIVYRSNLSMQELLPVIWETAFAERNQRFSELTEPESPTAYEYGDFTAEQRMYGASKVSSKSYYERHFVRYNGIVDFWAYLKFRTRGEVSNENGN